MDLKEKELIISDCNNKLLKKKTLIAGDYSLSPLEGAKCEIELSDVRFRREGKECPADDDSRIFSTNFPGILTIGEGTHYLDVDFERCLQSVYANEICLIQMTYYKLDETEGLEVSCVVKMSKVEDVALFCDWHWAKKVTYAVGFKDAGVDLIRKQRTIDAFRQFSKSLKILLTLGKDDYEAMSDEDKKSVDDLKAKLYNNLAHCQLQYKEYEATIDLCNKTLELDSDNVKALYRRGSAYMGLEDWESALNDISRVLALDQTITEAKAKIGILREKVKDINDAYKKTIKNMFN